MNNLKCLRCGCDMRPIDKFKNLKEGRILIGHACDWCYYYKKVSDLED